MYLQLRRLVRMPLGTVHLQVYVLPPQPSKLLDPNADAFPEIKPHFITTAFANARRFDF